MAVRPIPWPDVDVVDTIGKTKALVNVAVGEVMELEALRDAVLIELVVVSVAAFTEVVAVKLAA